MTIKKELYDKALSHYETAINSNPTNAMYHGNSGYIQALMNDWEKAANAFKQAIILDPSQGIYDHLLGQIYEREDKLLWAIPAYKSAQTKFKALQRRGKLTSDQRAYAAHINRDLKRCEDKLPLVWWPMKNGRVHGMGAVSLYM